jgi:hypothetical protein
MRKLLVTNEGINEFNRHVTDFNNCCGSYRYRRGSLEIAQRDVENNRSSIVSEAVQDAAILNQASVR